jgi:hypothetical protein
VNFDLDLAALCLHLNPTDVLLISPKYGHLSTQQARELQEHLAARLTVREVVVLPFPTDAAVVTQEEADERVPRLSDDETARRRADRRDQLL